MRNFSRTEGRCVVRAVIKFGIVAVSMASVMLMGVPAAEARQELVPKFRSAITKQLEPVNNGDPFEVEVTTVVTYPFTLDLVGVASLPDASGLTGPMPMAVAENLDARRCPEPAFNRPGGLACRQRFRVLFPYNACGLSADAYNLKLKYTTPGQPEENVAFQLSTTYWCSVAPVQVNPPTISSLSHSIAYRSTPFDLVIYGTNLANGGVPTVRIYNVNVQPTEYTNNWIIVRNVHLPNYLGQLRIVVESGGGMSNPGYIMMW